MLPGLVVTGMQAAHLMRWQGTESVLRAEDGMRGKRRLVSSAVPRPDACTHWPHAHTPFTHPPTLQTTHTRTHNRTQGYCELKEGTEARFHQYRHAHCAAAGVRRGRGLKVGGRGLQAWSGGWVGMG